MATPTVGPDQAPERRSAGTLPTKRRQLDWPKDRDFRILSLDGGGIKGIFTLAALAALERNALGGASIARCFDLIAGTSTGGIIALGLSAGRTASEILDIYLKQGRSVFPRPRQFGVLRPAFSATALAALLKEVLGDRLLKDAENRLCVPSCEKRFGDVNVFKTPHHPDFKMDWKLPMREIALATSAAPTFLPVHRFGGYLYVDGGVWANNPAMVAVVDALTCFDLQPRQLRMLSIGTGAGPIRASNRHVNWGGIVSWMFKGHLIESLMNYASLNADGQAGLMMGRDHLVRIAPQGRAAEVQMTDYRAAHDLLVDAGEAAALALVQEVQADFLYPAARPHFYY
ncbi:MAG: Patatin-like phospholipase [Caulobacteraceae bacterium]|nr:Patatin-like phospholipase [Caulobacteraceae bacterium]